MRVRTFLRQIRLSKGDISIGSAAAASDLALCPGCGEELDPDASGARRYHSDACRAEARRAGHGRVVVGAV